MLGEVDNLRFLAEILLSKRLSDQKLHSFRIFYRNVDITKQSDSRFAINLFQS